MSFDRLAPHYRWMEAALAGDLLQRCRMRWLSEVRESRHALLVGEGNGRMLEACATALPECEFTVLDQSEAMLAQARRRWRKTGGKQKVRFQCVDLRDWRADVASFDLVVTHFFLDCFAPEELAQVIGNISIAASNPAKWLVTDFCVPLSGWQRIRARTVLALAYGFFRATTGISASGITSPETGLRAVGFERQRQALFNCGLLHADLWARDK